MAILLDANHTQHSYSAWSTSSNPACETPTHRTINEVTFDGHWRLAAAASGLRDPSVDIMQSDAASGGKDSSPNDDRD